MTAYLMLHDVVVRLLVESLYKFSKFLDLFIALRHRYYCEFFWLIAPQVLSRDKSKLAEIRRTEIMPLD